MKMAALVAILLAPVLVAPALAVDKAFPIESEFDRAVHWVELQSGIRQTHIPLLGLATFLAGGVGRPLGAKDFKLAIFEGAGREITALRRGAAALDGLGPGWRTILQVTQRGRDQVHIYGRDEDGWVKMLMLTLDESDAVVMQFKLRPTYLLEFVAQEARKNRHHSKTAMVE